MITKLMLMFKRRRGEGGIYLLYIIGLYAEKGEGGGFTLLRSYYTQT